MTKLISEATDCQVPFNPVGALQERCMMRQWPLPEYHLSGENGPSHMKEFFVVCSLQGRQETASGRSKKAAKHNAANQMLLRLGLEDDEREHGGMGTQEYSEAEDRVASIDMGMVKSVLTDDPASRFSSLKGNQITVSNTFLSCKVAGFMSCLRRSQRDTMKKIHACRLDDPKFDYVQFLYEFSSDHGFEVTYIHVNERSITGDYQCLAALGSIPFALCLGSGSSSLDAKTSAAHYALEYLKIMTVE